MKNRLYSFVNKINKAVDSMTKALENSGPKTKQQDNNGSIIDRLPVGESKKIQKQTPVKQNVEKSAPVVTTVNKKPEPSTVSEQIIYSMYLCPECRKVFKVKGNDKTVKCSHCEGIHLKDMHIEELVWKAYGKDERDKIISNILDEEEFEEAFEEVIEEPVFESIHESSKFFDENGEFIDNPITVKTDSSNKNYKGSNSLLFPDDDEPKASSSGSFFSGFEDLDSGNGIGFGNSVSNNTTKTYNKPVYSESKVEKKTTGNKPLIAIIALVLVSVISVGSYSVSKMKAQIDQYAYDEELGNEAVDSQLAKETTTETNEYQTVENNNNDYLNENYTTEEPDYSYDEYETNDSTYINNDYGYSYEQNYENEYDDSDDSGYDEDNSDYSEDEDSSYPPVDVSYGSIIVNKNTGMIHNAGCGNLPYEENSLYFNSLQDAIDAGYHKRCSKCNP